MELTIIFNNAAVTEPCALCGQTAELTCGYAIVTLEGGAVCGECAMLQRPELTALRMVAAAMADEDTWRLIITDLQAGKGLITSGYVAPGREHEQDLPEWLQPNVSFAQASNIITFPGVSSNNDLPEWLQEPDDWSVDERAYDNDDELPF